ncbi:MAG: MmcB family DNA repair protein [Pseudomonadota bacterium]
MPGVEHNRNILPAARPDITTAVTRGVTRLFVDMGLTPLCEFRLVNGRRADVAALDAKGDLIIAEVKSGREDYETDAKWAEYLKFCDAFYFAVSESFPQHILPADEGLIVADAYGGAVIRQPQSRPLASARRKAVTLRFARQAAMRVAAL